MICFSSITQKNFLYLVLFIALPFLANAQYIGQHKEVISIPAKIAVKATSFDLKDVRLLPSRFKENMDRAGAW